MYSNKPNFSKSQEMNIGQKIQQVQQVHCSRIEESESISSQGGSQIKELIKTFKQFLQVSKQQYQIGKKEERGFDYQDLEPRDRKVVIKLPEQFGQLSQTSLENYITQLCNTVWSKAFYYFSNNQLSYEYTKIYSSQQVLQNLVRLSEKFYLKPCHFQIINSHIQIDVLGYMLNKYPMTLDQEINKNVNSAIKQIDKSGELVNDYLYNSSINFSLRQTGQYNDLIMRSVNQILTKIESKVRNRSIYEKFQHKMEKLFQSVTDEDWMKEKDDNKSQIEEIDSYQRLYGINSIKESGLEDTQFKRENVSARMKEREKEKYKQRVQAYTSYKIGRKLPESMRLFTAQQIASHNIKVQNPQTLRILMKWCEQLQRKFKTANYYEQYVENLKLENGKSVCLVLDDIKICLDQLMADQSIRIIKQTSELSKNNSYLQSQLLMRDLFIKGNNSVQKYERIAANYSIDIVNNLHSYIITYLNRLLHGLLTVATKFSQLPEVCHMQLPSKVNLITFQIFDMIRCKCNSGEKQTIRLYTQILKLCEGENAKLVRVINRMKRGTHDILINIRYRDVLCEIQLGVTNNKNQFIEYSNRFNHYLYELKRSSFGPLTQLCSIWKSLDVKFSIYKSVPQKPQSHSRESRIICSNHYSYEIYNKPFICSSCSCHFYQCYYIKSHLKCKVCEYWICAKCQIESSDCKSLLNAAYKNQEIIQKCTKVKSKSNFIPQYGICIYIESQEILVQPFRKIELKNSNKVFGIKSKRLYEIYDVSNDQKIAKFHEKFVIFQVKSTFGKKHIKIDDEKVRQYLIQQKMKRSFKNNKEKICLNYSSIVNNQLDKLIELAPRQQRSNIKKIQLIGNNLENIQSIAENFPAIKILEVSKNNLKQFDGILRLAELEKLYINDNGLSEFPKQICELQNLKQLSLCENRIKNFPEKMKNHTLKSLMLSHNTIEQIPTFVQDMKQICELNLKNNHIKEIPHFVGHLTKLELLQVQNNQIAVISDQIGRLENLHSLNLSFNCIATLPVSLSKLKSLNRLQIRNNKLTELPNLNSLEKLDIMDASNNLLVKVPNIYIPKLTHLNLSYNQIVDFSQLQQPVSNLKVLMLAHNKLKSIPNLEYIGALEELYLNCNQIQIIYPLYKLHKLQILSLEHNKLAYFESVRMEKLRQLSLSQNKLQQFSRMEFNLLEELDLSHNGIRQFDNNIMPSVRKLNLNNNQLHSVKLTNYPKLKYIYISHNILVTVPEVNDRNQIKTICLDNNCIKILSGNILHSESLNHLNLAFNEIKHIPEELQKIVNLQDKALELSRNPIESVDCWDFIFKKGTKSTVEHLEDIKAKLKSRYSTQTV